MFEAGASTEDAGRLIRKYLKIILITKAERKRLDSADQLNLKQRMPEGWMFGRDSPYARLNAAGIEFHLFPGRS